jgi:hypothetical protein
MSQQERLKIIQEFLQRLEIEINPQIKRTEGPSPGTEYLESPNAKLLIHLN